MIDYYLQTSLLTKHLKKELQMDLNIKLLK